MRSILDALQEGRLIELPEVSKEEALEYLAHTIEAVPDIGNTTDLAKIVMDREAQFNTGIGKGVAVPHCRTNLNGELLCAVGWAPHGIEYGALDGKPVHLLVMYYVPDAQRNLYLKEISSLAKVLNNSDTIETITQFEHITTVREKLLDWISLSVNEATPDAKARMIKLESRQATVETQESVPAAALVEEVSQFHPFKLVSFGDHILVLTSETALADTLEHDDTIRKHLHAGARCETAGWKVVVLSETVFSHGRKIFEAVAYKG